MNELKELADIVSTNYLREAISIGFGAVVGIGHAVYDKSKGKKEMTLSTATLGVGLITVLSSPSVESFGRAMGNGTLAAASCYAAYEGTYALLEKISQAKEKTEQVYCQNCGAEITNDGGDVSDDGRIYCHGYRKNISRDTPLRCLEESVFKGHHTGLFTMANYQDAKEVQKLIRKKKLTEYNSIDAEIIDIS